MPEWAQWSTLALLLIDLAAALVLWRRVQRMEARNKRNNQAIADLLVSRTKCPH